MRIGTVTLLRDRIYEEHSVPVGAYPIMQDGNSIYFATMGYPVKSAAGGVDDLGDGMFVVKAPRDHLLTGKPAPVRSKIWTLSEFRAFIESDPACRPGPDQRLIITLSGGAA